MFDDRNIYVRRAHARAIFIINHSKVELLTLACKVAADRRAGRATLDHLIRQAIRYASRYLTEEYLCMEAPADIGDDFLQAAMLRYVGPRLLRLMDRIERRQIFILTRSTTPGANQTLSGN